MDVREENRELGVVKACASSAGRGSDKGVVLRA